MLQVQINAEIERRLADVAARTGETASFLAEKALLAYLEDLEDYADAVEAWKEHDPAKTVSLEDMMARYGVEG